MKRPRTSVRANLAPAIFFIVGLILLGGPTPNVSAQPTFRHWTGQGAGPVKLWSDPSNWSPTGAPENGEYLDFQYNAILTSPPPMVNDLSNLVVQSMFFSASLDFGAAEWHLSGNRIAVLQGIRLAGSDQSIFLDCPLGFANNARLWLDSSIADHDRLYLSGTIQLNGDLDVIVAHQNTLELSGPITGAGDLNVFPTPAPAASDGTVTLSGNEPNTFAGVVRVHSELTHVGFYRGAHLVLNKQSGVAVPGALIMERESETKLARSQQIADNATVTIRSGGALLLQGHDETIGRLILMSGATETNGAAVNTGNGVLSVTSNIVATASNSLVTHVIQGRLELPSGEHMIEVSSAGYAGLDLQAQVSGFGNFTKSGTGALILSTSNSYNSSITIAEGLLDVRHDHALGDIAGSTAILGGALTLRDVAIGEELLFASGQGTGGDLPGSVLNVVGTASWAGQVALYTNLNVIGGDVTFTGPISGTGGLGCFSGGTITLGGTLPNTYIGPTLSRSPLLLLAKSGGARALSGPLEVGSSSGPEHEVRWLGSAQAPNATVTLHETARINLNGFDDTFGSITFNGGEIDTGTGLLGIGGLVTVNHSPSGRCSIGGRIYLPPGYHEFRVNDGDTVNSGLQVSAMVTGPGQLQKTGFGTMRLLSSNSYSGLTLVDQGRLAIAHGQALGSSDAGTVVAEGALLQVWVSDGGAVRETISLRGQGPGLFGSLGAMEVQGTIAFRTPFPSIYACLDLPTNALIRILTNSTLILDGFISGQGSLTKFGEGTLVFSNANPNTYSGDTIIQEGTLELRKPDGVLAVPGSLVIGPATVASPATVRFFESDAVVRGGFVTVNAHSLLDLNGYNQGVRTLALNDGGDAQTGAGTLSFSSRGSVEVDSLNGLGSRSSSLISGHIGLATNSQLPFLVSPYAPNALNSDPELVVSASIPDPSKSNGSAGIYKSGAGQLRLTGNNSFDGRVDVVAGTLSIGTPTALGSTLGSTYVSGDATLVLLNGITVQGETLELNSGSPAALDNLAGNNYWLGPIELDRDSGIRVSQDWSLAVEGVIRGTGGLTKHGGGILTLGGAGNNTYSGNTYVNEGTLKMAKASGLQAVPADLFVGQTNGSTTATARHLNHDQIWANTTVNHGGLLDLNGFDEWTAVLTLNGGGDVQTGIGTIYPLTSVSVNPGNFGDPSLISGRLGLYQGTIPVTVGAGALGGGAAECLISATILQSAAGTGLQKYGGGALRLTGTNTYTGSTTISGGILWVDSVQAQSTVLADASTTLKGSGAVGPIYLVGLGTSLMPGSSPGVLTCSGLTQIAPASGTLHVELNGLTPGAGYDQLDVHGPVNLTGLTLSASLGFASAVSNQFTIIVNDGTDAVSGPFAGLPQGKKLYIGQELFQISYTGGTGNDVVLTRLVTPPPPVLTVERATNNAVRLIWPTNDPSFNLQTTTNLLATNWTAALPLPTVVGTNHIVTNPVDKPAQFYRLTRP